MQKQDCCHFRREAVLIGYDRKEGALMYQMSVCLDCGKYIDAAGGLRNFEEKVSGILGRQWQWEEEYMPDEELASLNKGNLRIVIQP
ncbi:MAG: hypothetical protein U5L10_02800 [Candidatus Moranbacteria bacterium]|nr:hypothetical protein [Candidatus Moranbacteria bacterium]